MMRITTADFVPLAVTADTPSEPVAASVCPHCDGAGYYVRLVPHGHTDFAVMQECTCRQERNAEREQQTRLTRSNLTALANKTFATFERRPGTLTALARAKAFVTDPYRHPWVTLTGPYGCGKTHLAAAIAHELASQLRLYVATVPDMLDELRSGYEAGAAESYHALMQRLRDHEELLVLDDLGTENRTPWADEKLFQILNHRWMHRRLTIITTNSDLSRMDGRIASRISDYDLTGNGPIQMTAADARRQPRSPQPATLA